MAVAAPGTIGLMGFTSQIVGISFPQKLDLAIIQANCLRDGVGGDTLAMSYGINQTVISTVSMPGYSSGFNITQTVPTTTTSNNNGSATNQSPVNLLLGQGPTPFNGFFGAGFKQRTMAWTYGSPVQVAYSPDSVHLDYASRGYVFINLTLFKQLLPGQNVIRLSTQFGGSTWSTYNLAVEILTGLRGLRFSGNLPSYGGVALATAGQMGWPIGNMSNWRLGTGTPSLSGAKTALNPVIEADINMSGSATPAYNVTMISSGFAANNVFSQKGGAGHE